MESFSAESDEAASFYCSMIVDIRVNDYLRAVNGLLNFI